MKGRPSPSPVLVVVLVLALPSIVPGLFAATPVTFDRYQVIIDRGPFGAVTGTRGADAAVPGFAERYVLVGVVPNPLSGQPRAILLDKKSNLTQLVTPGENVEGIEVVEVNVQGEDSQLVLRHGFETATLRYLPRSAAPPAAAPPGVVVAPVAGTAKPAVRTATRPTVPQPTRRIPFRRE